MGTFHLSGMGLSPGAVTVPLTYVYLLLKSASRGNQRAIEFFETSGGPSQKTKGAPECLIIFTSSEVIKGTRDVTKKVETEDNWFRSKENPVKVKPVKAIGEYLHNLWGALEDTSFRPFYGGDWIKDIYFVEVDRTNFDDCLRKIGTTVYALREKELWVNMIGGTNPINVALLFAETLYAAVARYYYVPQEETKLLHPEFERPDMNDPSGIVKEALGRWHELPFFHLMPSELISRLDRELTQRDMNVRELERILQEGGFTRQFIPKLRGRLVKIDGERVSRGPLLDKVARLDEAINKKIEDFSKWLKWARDLGILWKMEGGEAKKVS